MLAVTAGADTRLDDIFFYGDTRLRGYYSEPLMLPATDPGSHHSDYSADSRMRLTAAMPISDSFNAKISLQWNSILAPGKGPNDAAVLGAYHWNWDHFGLGPSELSWNDIFFTPFSLRAARDTISFDEGLLFSATDSEWLFDHAALSYDIPSLKIACLYGSVSWLSPDSTISEFAFTHAQYNTEWNLLPSFSGYAGTFRMQDDGKPVIAGLHSTILRSRNWKMYAEAAGETGTRPGNQSLLAAVTDAGLLFRPTQQKHVLARWTFASGDADPTGRHAFIPLFNYENWGCVFSPKLSNIHILSLKSTFPLSSLITCELAAYSYFQAHRTQAAAGTDIFNNGGYTRLTDGTSHELGTEADGILRYQLSPDFTLELRGGYFIRGSAYAETPGAENASELSLQARVTF